MCLIDCSSTVSHRLSSAVGRKSCFSWCLPARTAMSICCFQPIRLSLSIGFWLRQRATAGARSWRSDLRISVPSSPKASWLNSRWSGPVSSRTSGAMLPSIGWIRLLIVDQSRSTVSPLRLFRRPTCCGIGNYTVRPSHGVGRSSQRHRPRVLPDFQNGAVDVIPRFPRP